MVQSSTEVSEAPIGHPSREQADAAALGMTVDEWRRERAMAEWLKSLNDYHDHHPLHGEASELTPDR